MIINKPHYIFAFFSLLVGVLLIFLVPPTSGIDESQHVRRAADVTEFKLLQVENYTENPLAIWAENGLVMQKESIQKNPHWDFYEMFKQLKEFPATLPDDRQVTLEKNPYAVHNPFMYAPFALVLNISNYLFHPEPWVQFYILRFTALLCSVFLITIAIARMSEHKTLLAAACLLPAMMNTRSGMNIDGIVIGIIFLFIGQVYILCRKESLFRWKDIAILALLGFLMAQTKGAYTPLLFLTLLLPKNKFASGKYYFFSLAMVILPSMVVGLGWSALVKNAVLSGIRYQNEIGDVWPDGQFEWLITHPFSYGMVLFKTIFASPLIPNLLVEFVGSIGWGQRIVISPLSYIILVGLLAAIMAQEPVKMPLQQSRVKRYYIGIIIMAAITFALTMLYVQWSSYQADIISGFQGRYLYPLLPLFMVFVKPVPEYVSKKRSILFLWLFGFVSSASLLWTTWSYYYL